jgi:hypothetical protein
MNIDFSSHDIVHHLGESATHPIEPRCSALRARARSVVVTPCQRAASQPTRARPTAVFSKVNPSVRRDDKFNGDIKMMNSKVRAQYDANCEFNLNRLNQIKNASLAGKISSSEYKKLMVEYDKLKTIQTMAAFDNTIYQQEKATIKNAEVGFDKIIDDCINKGSEEVSENDIERFTTRLNEEKEEIKALRSIENTFRWLQNNGSDGKNGVPYWDKEAETGGVLFDETLKMSNYETRIQKFNNWAAMCDEPGFNISDLPDKAKSFLNSQSIDNEKDAAVYFRSEADKMEEYLFHSMDYIRHILK